MHHKVTEQNMLLQDFVQHAYLDYAMYVILDRALPHIADGLKPVQRRIVYAMGELGLAHHAKFKKSARTVGDVLGKFHPHGETACYEAMVHMAQSFSYRYPLIDGQGNWGAPDDPKSFAAMRYTEARLTAYAYHILLSELKQNTISWKPNFDGTMDEPDLLPSRLPNILLNGASGIAVGMATDIPPHNTGEVIDACCHLLEHPASDLHELFQYIKGPDFPAGGAMITTEADLQDIYIQGRGSVKLRACFRIENQEIIIEQLPAQVTSSKILEQIAQQMQMKKLPMVVDLRDESDHACPVRLVLVLRSQRIDADQVMQHLFAVTDLEKNQKVNFNMIGLDHRPQVKNIKQILTEWLHFRRQTVKRRLQNRLHQVQDRLHILAGLLTVYLHIDEVIRIIRSEDQPKKILQQRFQLSALQVDAILEIRLRQLAKLEKIRLQQEQQGLQQEQEYLEKILGSTTELTQLLRTELLEDKKRFADQRRTRLVAGQSARVFSRHELLGAEPVTVILSEQGWIRSAKGHQVDVTGLAYKTGDQLLMALPAKTNQQIAFFTRDGRSYTILVDHLPSARSYGEPLSSRFKFAATMQCLTATVIKPDIRLLWISSDAYGFITTGEDVLTKNKAGKAVVQLKKGAELLSVQSFIIAKDQQLAAYYLALVSSHGYMLIFALNALPQLVQGRGNKLISLTRATAQQAKQQQAVLTASCILKATDHLLVYAGKRHLHLKPGDWQHYLGKRAQKGRPLPRGFSVVQKLEPMPSGKD